MGSSETNSPTASQSPSGKRSRDPEDEVYIDNLNSHKRYLSEMMASSLNCLSVGDPIPDNVLDSPARSESMFYSRDDMALQYSPMSEDLDDARYYETPMSACSSQSESRPTSPVSPYRYKPVGAFCSSPPSTSLSSSGCNAFSGTSQSRQRGSDTEGRFPSSPSDICHSSDLRKAALLRSVQMRTQPSCSSAYDLSFTAMQNAETETRSSSFLKPLDGEREYHDEECPVMPLSELGFDQGKSMELNMSEFNQGKDSMGMNMVEFNQGKGSMGLDMIEFDQGKNPLGLNMGEYDQGKNSMGFGHGEFHQGKNSMGLTMGEYDQGKGSMGLNMDNFDQGKDPMVLNMNDSDQGKNSMGLNMGEYDRGKVPMGLNMDNFDQGKDPMVLNMNDSDQGKNSMGLNMGEFDQGKDSMGLTIGELDREKDSMGLNMGEAERSANL